MSAAFKKILLWLIMLMVTIFIYGAWKLSSSERDLGNWIRTDLAATNTQPGISISSLQISAIDGNVVFNDVTYYESAGLMLFSAEKLTIEIGRSASLKLAVLPVAHVLNQLEETRIIITGMKDVHGDDLAASTEIKLLGNPLQLPAIIEKTFPTESLSLNIHISALNFGVLANLYPPIGFFIPNDPETEFQAVLYADARTQLFNIDVMELDHNDFIFNLTGTMTPQPDTDWGSAKLDGVISVTRLSPAMNNLVSNLEQLFEIQLNRRGGDILLSISGTPSRPDIR